MSTRLIIRNMDAPIACNLNVFSASESRRYQVLRRAVQEAVRESRELSDGFGFRLDETSISFSDAAEWVSLEKRCCPFLSFQMNISGAGPDYWLHLTGPDGVKAILRNAFGESL